MHVCFDAVSHKCVSGVSIFVVIFLCIISLYSYVLVFSSRENVLLQLSETGV